VTLMISVIGAVLLTVAVLLSDWRASPASERFVKNERFLIWAALLCAQSALWVILAPPIWRSLRRLLSEYGASRRLLVEIGVSAAVIVALVVGFVVVFGSTAPKYPLPHRATKLHILTGAGFLVTLLALVGMWLVEAAIGRTGNNQRTKAMVEYLRLRADLGRFLSAAAAIIAAATLSTGALRGAVLANVPGEKFPPEYVLYYGAYFSALLALAYAPAYITCREAGRRLADALLPLPDDESGSWADWYANRKALEAMMELDIATSKGMQTGLAVAAPFLGSAIGLLLGTSA
jgi:hypothetical protein